MWGWKRGSPLRSPFARYRQWSMSCPGLSARACSLRLAISDLQLFLGHCCVVELELDCGLFCKEAEKLRLAHRSCQSRGRMASFPRKPSIFIDLSDHILDRGHGALNSSTLDLEDATANLLIFAQTVCVAGMRPISGLRIGITQAFAFCTSSSERFSSRMSQGRHEVLGALSGVDHCICSALGIKPHLSIAVEVMLPSYTKLMSDWRHCRWLVRDPSKSM